jgi:hypothetical protein
MHDLAGQTFGRLKVLWRDVDRKGSRVYWLCQCSCGERHSAATNKLTSGNTKSCGCLAQEMRGQPRITHGETRGPRSQWSPRTKMLYAAKARAVKDGLPFDITLDDIIVPEMCPVLGISIAKNSSRCQPNSPSLDKIIPQNGYVKGNVEVISHKANTIKSNATIEELEKVLEYMRSKQG